jgi:hypothetical protein
MTMTTGQTIRAIPANAVPLKLDGSQMLALPRVPVNPTLATSPRPTCVMLPNQPVPPREVFQRPLPPSNIRPQMVRAILIPRPGINPGQQQQQTVFISQSTGQLQPQVQQRLQSINTGTPLPNIQLPSEPLPITAEMQQHLSASSSISSPSPSPSPATLDHGNYGHSIDGSQNGFVGNGNSSTVHHHQDDGVVKQGFQVKQQNPQKILIQVSSFLDPISCLKSCCKK